MRVEGPGLHEGQLRAAHLIQGPAKYVTVVAPRQVGKSFLGLQCILYWAINEPGSVIFFCSPTYNQAKKPMEELYNAIQASGIVKSYNKSDFRIELKNGSVIYFKSTERENSLRGFTGTHMIIDEAAYHGEEVWSSVLKPIMLVKGRKVLFISTPRGNNWFKKMYDAGQDPSQEDYASCKMHYSENPYLNLKELEEAKRSLPDHIFQAEYEGSFTESGSRVFRMDKIKAFDSWPKAEGRVVCGIDWGRANDFTIATFMDEKGRVLEVYRENQTDWAIMVDNILKLVRKWNAHVVCEQNSIGDVLVEMMQRQWPKTEPFVTSSKSKNEIIEGLAVDLHSQHIQIPSQALFAPLYFELDIFEYTYSTKSRVIQYSAPQSFHDDCVISLAICNWARKQARTYGQYVYQTRSI